jgi:hypothetical protein
MLESQVQSNLDKIAILEAENEVMQAKLATLDCEGSGCTSSDWTS